MPISFRSLFSIKSDWHPTASKFWGARRDSVASAQWGGRREWGRGGGVEGSGKGWFKIQDSLD